jgi:hypothetical protein
MKDVTLTAEEARALFDIIDQLAGGNPESVFAWDGTDSPFDPTSRAAAKLFVAVGRPVPKGLEATP